MTKKDYTKKDFSEADMYKPVKDFFTGLGYAVNGEVRGMDITMIKDGVLYVVELKKSFNMKLLYQAVDRQSVTSQVFVGVPKPRFIHGRECELTRRIIKRLGIGLIFVNMDGSNRVEIDTFPPTAVKSPSKKRSERVLKEIAGRSIDVNTGGQTKKPIATAYREKAIKLACLLERYGALSPSELVNGYGCDKGTRNLLNNNHHGWFEKVSKGRYGLSAQGIGMLMDESAGGAFKELIDSYRNIGLSGDDYDKA